MEQERLKAERDALREAIKRHRAAAPLGGRRPRDEELYRALAWRPAQRKN
jgi:hypothetical protein